VPKGRSSPFVRCLKALRDEPPDGARREVASARALLSKWMNGGSMNGQLVESRK